MPDSFASACADVGLTVEQAVAAIKRLVHAFSEGLEREYAIREELWIATHAHEIPDDIKERWIR